MGKEIIGKGIFQQMMEATAIPRKPMTEKEFERMLEDVWKNERKEFIRKQEIIKQNMEDLFKREMELGESAPWLLWYYTSTVEMCYVSSEQMKAWKKWAT